LAGGALVRLPGGALERDAPGQPAAGARAARTCTTRTRTACTRTARTRTARGGGGGGADLVDERCARRACPVGEDDDLLEAEAGRVPHHVEEAGLERGLAAEEGDLHVPEGARPVELGEHRGRVGHPGVPPRCLLARDAEDAAVVAQVAELDLDLLLRH